jgi:surfactin synthase thioesterase subunit
VSPAFAQSYINQEGAEFEVDVINGGHVPMLSRSEAAVDVIRRFAEDTVESEVGARGNKL